MAILNRLLYILKFLETLAEFGDFLLSSVGIVLVVCLLSDQALLFAGCDVTTAAILASAIAMTLHCTLTRPNY
jgi:hypothetical protein